MNPIRTALSLASALVLSTAMTAQFVHQITYVDADTATNTTRADGTPYVPIPTINNTDNEWTLRPFANGGTILTSHDGTGTEDAPMLRTTITGLIPTLTYYVYSYWWSDGGSWRGRSLVSTSQPAPQIPGYNTVHFSTSAFSPMQPLAQNAVVGAGQATLSLMSNANGFEIGGHFANQPLILEGNRTMYETWLGAHQADVNGEIQVYIDDLEGNQSGGNRTWYDGVGYEIAPLEGNTGCGNPLPQIGYVGAPIMTTDFSVTVSGAPAMSLAVAVIGFSDTVWSGGPLPFGLGLLGFPGCNLLVSVDAITFTLTDASGDAGLTVNAPSGPPLTLYWQWGVLDASNSLSATSKLETWFHR